MFVFFRVEIVYSSALLMQWRVHNACNELMLFHKQVGILTLTGCNCTSSAGYAHGSPQVNLPWNSSSDTHTCKELVMEIQHTIIHNIITFFLAYESCDG